MEPDNAAESAGRGRRREDCDKGKWRITFRAVNLAGRCAKVLLLP